MFTKATGGILLSSRYQFICKYLFVCGCVGEGGGGGGGEAWKIYSNIKVNRAVPT